MSKTEAFGTRSVAGTADEFAAGTHGENAAGTHGENAAGEITATAADDDTAGAAAEATAGTSGDAAAGPAGETAPDTDSDDTSSTAGGGAAGEIATVVERVWRDEAAGMLGVLGRRLGDLDLAEEALQEAVAEALLRWAVDGVPTKPAGWLVTAAWRKAIDRLRREANGRAKEAALMSDPTRGSGGGEWRSAEPARLPGDLEPGPAWPPSEDDRLALIFTCCHPALPEASRVALTLHAVGGLSAETVAAAFLLPKTTVAQRLVRAKRHLRDQRVRVETPPPEEYAARFPSVSSVIYLIYNEGYLATSDRSVERRELAREGLDLARQVADLMPGEPEAVGLAALLELHESRAAARFDAAGRMVLLEDQDRSAWDRPLIASALRRLGRVAALGRPGPYQVEAAIAAQHALAPSWERTDWPVLHRLYTLLAELRPTPVVLLGRAVATGFTAGPAAALAEVEELGGRLDGYRLWHATRADLLRRLGRPVEAAEATRRALALATNPAERDLLARRLDDLTTHQREPAPGAPTADGREPPADDLATSPGKPTTGDATTSGRRQTTGDATTSGRRQTTGGLTSRPREPAGGAAEPAAGG